jgi:K+-sensing histidine kinase KdpD
MSKKVNVVVERNSFVVTVNKSMTHFVKDFAQRFNSFAYVYNKKQRRRMPVLDKKFYAVDVVGDNVVYRFTRESLMDFSVNEEKQMAIFSVTDTGCGIPKEKQGLVFERFEKLNEYAQGTGLGLSICKLIVHKWRGSIWIDPDYTGGARFVFSHPLNIEKE